MAHILKDRVKDSTTTTGTGSVALANSAPTGFRTFGSVCANGDTAFYCIAHRTANEWEVGLGTYSTTGPSMVRTTVLASSNANALVSFSTGTKDIFNTMPADYIADFDNQKVLQLPATANPSVPAADNIYFYARKISGRVMPKWMPPTGVDVVIQPALFGNKIVTFAPSSGTVGTGSVAFSPAWTSNGTVSHPTPSNTSPAISNQMKRTRYANVVTTTNQQLGPRFNAASEQQFWTGNAAGLGGFYFVTRFIVELYPASTVRIFAGLTSTATGSVAISDTVLANTCGLWHDTTDPSTGAGAFNFVTKNAATATKQPITLSNAIAAGNSYDFYMFCPPNSSTLYWRLDDIVNNVTYENSTSTTLPVNTAFMQPQVQMSNGTANTTVTTSAIGIVGIYVESDR